MFEQMNCAFFLSATNIVRESLQSTHVKPEIVEVCLLKFDE